MNGPVDVAGDLCKTPNAYEQYPLQMLRDFILNGVPVGVCGTCMARCWICKNHPYFKGANKSTTGRIG